MRKTSIDTLYFRWLRNLVCSPYARDYATLMHHLHRIDFHSDVGLDCNRAVDGCQLRKTFCADNGYDEAELNEALGNRPCSVFEMMVALANRCEEQLMWNPDLGNRTSKWFHGMIVSLNLEHMTNDFFNEQYVNTVIEKFLAHNYKRNGQGGLFTIIDCEYDLRTVEIWYQMCWYLDKQT
jgi:hypothetical protein